MMTPQKNININTTETTINLITPIYFNHIKSGHPDEDHLIWSK